MLPVEVWLGLSEGVCSYMSAVNAFTMKEGGCVLSINLYSYARIQVLAVIVKDIIF